MKRRKQRYGKVRAIPRRVWGWTLFWLVLAVLAIACSHRLTPMTEPPRPAETPPVASDAGKRPIDAAHLELPELGEQDTVIYNEAGRYTFLYRPEGMIAHWVAYKLTLSDMTGEADRSDAFAPDALLTRYGWRSATHSDYRGSGFDRGHLLPSADRTCSEEANRATFLYSNMAPQTPRLNRGAWKLLEEKLRKLAADYDTLYIVVGTVLPPQPKRIGSGVAVPELFFKAVALRREDDFEGAAYVMPNETKKLTGKDYTDFEVSIDSVERLSGLNLFPNIPTL